MTVGLGPSRRRGGRPVTGSSTVDRDPGRDRHCIYSDEHVLDSPGWRARALKSESWHPYRAAVPVTDCVSEPEFSSSLSLTRSNDCRTAEV